VVLRQTAGLLGAQKRPHLAVAANDRLSSGFVSVFDHTKQEKMKCD
jgi:hypothetical protein